MLKNKWKYHVILWIIVVIVGYISDWGIGGVNALKFNISNKGLRVDGVFYLTSIIIYFINYKYVCPRFLSKKKSVFFVFSFIILIILFAFIRYTIDEVIIKNIVGTNNYYGNSLQFKFYIFDNFHFAIKPILYSTIIYFVFRTIKAQEEILQLRINHKKAELNFLRSQISPHFLFNTLNTFYSELMITQPNTAKDVLKLSELLRYVTYETEGEFIALKKEINFIEDYIYFHKKRFENELHLTFSVEGKVEDQEIASLVLMHFIENVFKHGVLNDKENEAHIKIRITDTNLEISTINKFDTAIKYMDSGIGVENLKRRLYAIYKEDYILNYSSNDSHFTTSLKLPL